MSSFSKDNPFGNKGMYKDMEGEAVAEIWPQREENINAEMYKTSQFAQKQEESDKYLDSGNEEEIINANEFTYKLESSGVSPPFLLSTKEGEFKLELSTENISKSWNKKNIQKIILTEYIASGSFKNVFKFKGEKGEEYNNLCISIAEGNPNEGKIKGEISGHKINFDIIHNSQKTIDRDSRQHFINIYQYGYYCRCFDGNQNPETCKITTKCPGQFSKNRVVGVYAIMEYASGGDLRERFKLLHVFKQNLGVVPFFPLWNDWFLHLSICLIKNICTALNSLHDKGYVHLDIKPANIVLMLSGDEKMPVDIKPEIISQEEWDFFNNQNIKLSKEDKWSIIKNTKIKIIDFGTCTKIKKFKFGDQVKIKPGLEKIYIKGVIDDENYQTEEGNISIIDIFDESNNNFGIIGTPYYIDPLFIINNAKQITNYYSKLSDIWSLGVTFFELFTGKNPWSKNYENVVHFFRDVLKQIKSNKELLDNYFDKNEFNKLDKIVHEIIGYMLKQNIKERKDCSFILEIISKYNLDEKNESGGKKKKSIKKKRKKYKLTKKKRNINRINY